MAGPFHFVALMMTSHGGWTAGGPGRQGTPEDAPRIWRETPTPLAETSTRSIGSHMLILMGQKKTGKNLSLRKTGIPCCT